VGFLVRFSVRFKRKRRVEGHSRDATGANCSLTTRNFFCKETHVSLRTQAYPKSLFRLSFGHFQWD